MTTTDRPRAADTDRPRTLRSVPPDASAGDVTQIWAEQQFAALGVGDAEYPEYGSPAWVKLRVEDPRRAAAIIEAAELYRRSRARTAWLDQLAEDDPDRWFALITADAEVKARQTLRELRVASHPTHAELAKRRAQYGPVREVKATPGWPPVTIPGRPGWRRHLIDGQQVDMPSNAHQNGQEIPA